MKAKSVRSAISTHKLAGGLMMVGLALVPAYSFGADALELEEIVVTAQKREERLLDVPVPVTAVTADTLLEQNQTKAEDFFASIPGVNLQTQYGRSQLAIRGITTGPASGNPVVGFTIDDVPFGSSTGNGGLFGAAPDIDPSELNHVEVLRGPQGTLYGAASMGGLVKYVLVDPSLSGVSGAVGVGAQIINDSGSPGYNVRGSINVPLSETMAMRASAYERTDAGYVDNVRTGEKDVNSAQVMGGRLAFLWKPSDELSVKLNALYQDRDVFGAGNVDATLGRSQQNNWSINDAGRVNTKNKLYSMVVNADLGGDMKLTSVTAYGQNTNWDITDFSAAPISGLWQFAFDPNSLPQFVVDDIFSPDPAPTVDPNSALNVNWGTILRQDYSVNKITQELRFSMPIGSQVDLLVGGFYTHESAKYGIRTSAFDQDGGKFYTQADYWPLLNPIPASATGNPNAIYSLPVVWDDNVRFSEVAAFANLTTRFTEQFDVQWGARYSKNRQKMNHREYTLFDPTGLFQDATYTGHSLTYQVAPRYKLSSDHMIYARVSTGYRAGGPNPACVSATIPCAYDPDKTKNYEIGAKGNVLGEAASYDLSVYKIEWNKIQITEAAGNFTFLENAGKAISQGVEASFALTPAEGLTLTLWGTYIDAKLKDPFITTAVFVRKGDRLPYSSRVSGRFSATQEFNLSGNMTAHLGGSITYVGDRMGEFIGPTAGATPDQVDELRAKLPAYTLVDLNSGLKVGDWKVNMFLQNVFDKRGINSGGYYNQSSWNQNWFITTQPRTVGVNAEWSF